MRMGISVTLSFLSVLGTPTRFEKRSFLNSMTVVDFHADYYHDPDITELMTF